MTKARLCSFDFDALQVSLEKRCNRLGDGKESKTKKKGPTGNVGRREGTKWACDKMRLNSSFALNACGDTPN
jgi:hypothetical protein